MLLNLLYREHNCRVKPCLPLSTLLVPCDLANSTTPHFPLSVKKKSPVEWLGFQEKNVIVL